MTDETPERGDELPGGEISATPFRGWSRGWELSRSLGALHSGL